MTVHYDNVVIGSTLSAAIFAYLHKYPLLFTSPNPPRQFEYFQPHLRFDEWGLLSENQQLHTTADSIEIGTSKFLLWERILFLLSMDGLLPLSNLCATMRESGEKIVCSDEYSKIHEFAFDTCHYFGDSGAVNIVVEASVEEAQYICYDYIAFHRGGKHAVDYMHTGDNFVGEIWFYSSDRICGNTGVKDACVVSRLTETQLADPNYSETMARFKMEKCMTEKGMRGPVNGYTSRGTPKYYNFKTSHRRRQIFRADAPSYIESARARTHHPPEEKLVELLLQEGMSKYGSLVCDRTLPV